MSLAHYEQIIHAQIFTNTRNLTELFPFFNNLLLFAATVAGNGVSILDRRTQGLFL
jgi:hypothetical protein